MTVLDGIFGWFALSGAFGGLLLAAVVVEEWRHRRRLRHLPRGQVIDLSTYRNAPATLQRPGARPNRRFP